MPTETSIKRSILAKNALSEGKSNTANLRYEFKQSLTVMGNLLLMLGFLARNIPLQAYHNTALQQQKPTGAFKY